MCIRRDYACLYHMCIDNSTGLTYQTLICHLRQRLAAARSDGFILRCTAVSEKVTEELEWISSQLYGEEIFKGHNLRRPFPMSKADKDERLLRGWEQSLQRKQFFKPS